MFGREFTGKGHRQHVLPPNPTSYSFEKVGSTKEALGLSGLSVGDEVYWYGGGDDVDTSASGVIVEFPAVDPDGRVHSDMAAVEWSDDGYEIVEVNNLLNAEHYNIGQGYSQALGSRKQADAYMDELKEWQPVEYDAFMESLGPSTVYEPGELEVIHKKWQQTQDPFDEGGDSYSASRKQASSLTWGHETAEQSLLGQEGWFANSGDGFHASIFEASGYIQLVPGAQRFDVDIYTDSNNYEHVSVNESGFESVDEAKSFVEGVFGYSRVSSRTAASADTMAAQDLYARFIKYMNDRGMHHQTGNTEFYAEDFLAEENVEPYFHDLFWSEFDRRQSSRTASGKCPKCDGMGRETYETDTGSLSTQTCKACGGTGQAKEAARRTSAVTWYDQSDQFGGMWSTYQGGAPDSPNGQISESNGTYRWYVSDSGTRGNQQTGESSSLEEAKREAESALASLGITASRTALHRTAFFDTIDLPEPRHRVAGWDWDDHLNGFLAAEAARGFTCSCGANVPAPGYTDCRCGKRWNAYTIQANGSKKMTAREVPVRENVVMARTARRKQADGSDDIIEDWLAFLDEKGLPRETEYADREARDFDDSGYSDEALEYLYEWSSGKMGSRKATRKQAELWEDLDSRDYEAVANALGGYDQAEDYWQDVRSAAPDLVSAIRDLKSDMDQLGVHLKVDQYWNLGSRKQSASHNLADVQADPSIVQEYDFVFTSSGRHLIEKVEPVDSQGIMRLHTSAGDVLMVRSRVIG